MSQLLTIDGLPVNAHQDIVFGEAGGVAPVVVVLELTLERAQRIFDSQKYVELALNGKKMMTIFPLELLPGSGPSLRMVRFADRRWEWPYKLIVGDYNLRRETGEVSVLGPRLEVHVKIPEIDYAPHSLFVEKSPHTSFDMITDVLTQLVGSDWELEAQLPKVDLENVLINDQGDAAVAHVLAKLPGIQVAINNETNRVRIYSDVSGAKIPEKQYDGALYATVASRRALRPSLVEIYFVEEAEARLNFTELTDASTVASSPETLDALDLENVVQVLEPLLRIPGDPVTGRKSRDVGYGTWVSMNEYLTALTAQVPPPTAIGTVLTQPLIRRHWLQGFSRLRPFYCLNDGTPDALWQGRLDSIYSCWRQTFRLNPRWKDRLLSVRAERTAVYDFTTGTHAPTAAYADYSSRPTWKGVARKDDNRTLGWNNRKYTAGGSRTSFSRPGSTVTPTPWQVTLEDEDSFIFRLSPRPDPHYEVERIAPGTINEDHYLRAGVNSFNRQGAAASMLLWEYAALEAGWEMSMIVTAIKGAPNHLGRYKKTTVGPIQASKILGTPIGPCAGPVMQVFVPMQLVTARYGWSDDLSAQIRSSFLKGTQMPQGMLVNKEHLDHVANAIAARVYESLLDRPDGAMVKVPFDEKLHPVGTLREVQHVLPTRGGLHTMLTFQGPTGPLDLWPLLPDGTRKALQHLVTR